MIKIKSLHQRFVLFILFPVGVLLFIMAGVGLLYTHDKLLNQWGEAAILKLQRAAHHVDMRLSRPRELMGLYASVGSEALRGAIVEQMRTLEGVIAVRLLPQEMGVQRKGASSPSVCLSTGDGWQGGLHVSGSADGLPGQPGNTVPGSGRTVSLVMGSGIKGGGGMEVIIGMPYILEHINDTGWWQSRKAFLVDGGGGILAGTAEGGRERLGAKGNVLEGRILEALKGSDHGTVLGRGFPSPEVGGFYRLEAAPWYLVMFAPGKEILAPITRSLLYCILVGVSFILSILLIIRRETARTASSIMDISEAADRIARGDYNNALEVKSRDEVGRLTEDFNTMMRHLKERNRMKASMNLAMEVQQNLLPGQTLVFDGLDVAGTSIYCDETGGDYYDYLHFSEPGRERLGIAVGDVVGHGIASALLMTTVRALLRSRVAVQGTLPEIIFDVNRSFCLDTADSGSFMTLFFMTVDTVKGEIAWVRAGHEAALLYDVASDIFIELKGAGVALGVDELHLFEENRVEWRKSQMVLIGTDGVWETENAAGERFGKERFCQVVRRNRRQSSRKIVEAVTVAVLEFRGDTRQEDDITLVAVRSGIPSV